MSFCCHVVKPQLLSFSVAVCQFSGRTGATWHVLVGTAKDVQLHPRQCAGGEVLTYKMDNDSKRLELIHKVKLLGREKMTKARF